VGPHSELNKKLKENCDITAVRYAALVQDLKQRGLLESTLLVWGGEFGRTRLGSSGGRMRPTTRVATIMRTASPCGWRAAASGTRDDRQYRRLGLSIAADPVHIKQSASDYSALSGTGSHAPDVPPHGS